MKNTFVEFCNEVRGYSFHSKKTGYQIYKFQLYWAKISPKECFEKFNFKEIKQYDHNNINRNHNHLSLTLGAENNKRRTQRIRKRKSTT